MDEIQLNPAEKEAWGDDELTAIDLSIPFLLEKADWTTFYNSKGYEGQYPFLLYSNEDADILNDRLLSEVNRTQILTGHNKLQADLFTRFIDHNDTVIGFIWLSISGTRAFAPDLLPDLEWLIKSGTTAYLQSAYSTDCSEVIVDWQKDIERHPSYEYVQQKLPPVSNLSTASYIFTAVLYLK